VTSSELSDTADPRSVPSDSSEATPIEVRPPSLGRRLWTFATQHVPFRWGELGKGLFGMSALASLVPFLDDPWLSGVFLGVSGVSLIRVLRQEADSISPGPHPSADSISPNLHAPGEPPDALQSDRDPAAEAAIVRDSEVEAASVRDSEVEATTAAASDRDSETAAAAVTSPAALIRIHDSLDRTADSIADIGKTLPLIIPQVWFGASLLAHAADGNWYYAAVSLAGTIFTSIPMFFRARRGIFKLRERWQAVEALQEKELEGENAGDPPKALSPPGSDPRSFPVP